MSSHTFALLALLAVVNLSDAKRKRPANELVKLMVTARKSTAPHVGNNSAALFKATAPTPRGTALPRPTASIGDACRDLSYTGKYEASKECMHMLACRGYKVDSDALGTCVEQEYTQRFGGGQCATVDGLRLERVKEVEACKDSVGDIGTERRDGPVKWGDLQNDANRPAGCYITREGEGEGPVIYFNEAKADPSNEANAVGIRVCKVLPDGTAFVGDACRGEAYTGKYDSAKTCAHWFVCRGYKVESDDFGTCAVREFVVSDSQCDDHEFLKPVTQVDACKDSVGDMQEENGGLPITWEGTQNDSGHPAGCYLMGGQVHFNYANANVDNHPWGARSVCALVPYPMLPGSGDRCVDGYDRVDSKSECQDLAEATGSEALTWGGEVSDPSAPSHCFYEPWGQGVLKFNLDTSATSDTTDSRHPVCAQKALGFGDWGLGWPSPSSSASLGSMVAYILLAASIVKSM